MEEVVWAKIKGFPWWPAIISNVYAAKDETREYMIHFLGDFSQYARLHQFEARGEQVVQVQREPQRTRQEEKQEVSGRNKDG